VRGGSAAALLESAAAELDGVSHTREGMRRTNGYLGRSTAIPWGLVALLLLSCRLPLETIPIPEGSTFVTRAQLDSVTASDSALVYMIHGVIQGDEALAEIPRDEVIALEAVDRGALCSDRYCTIVQFLRCGQSGQDVRLSAAGRSTVRWRTLPCPWPEGAIQRAGG
jgi:hypothetical protein